MDGVPPKSVVVGVDRSAGADAALEWAAAEARLRDVPLRIANSWSNRDHELPEGKPVGEPAYEDAALYLDEAAAALRTRWPGLDVDTVLLDEAPVEGLIGLVRDAGLLVVGRRGRNPFLTMLLGSVSQRLVAHAPVPVVVVPESPRPTAAHAAVVVGVARELPEPLDFAFAEAEARGGPLIAVRGWTISNPYRAANPEAVAEIEAYERRELDSLVKVVRRRHPSVPTETRVEYATAEAALVEASESAALLVLGRHRRHDRYGLPLGRVPHRVLHLSDLPVAVVPG